MTTISVEDFTAERLAWVISASLTEGAHGILLSSLPAFNEIRFFRKLKDEQAHHPFYLCLPEAAASTRAAVRTAGFKDEDLVLSIEKTVRLRSVGDKPLVVLLPREPKKSTSLNQFQRLRAGDLLGPVCSAGRQAARNRPQREFWDAIEALGKALPIEGILRFASVVTSEGPVDTKFGQLLFELGLMADKRLLEATGSVEIAERLRANLEVVKQLEQLTAKDLSALRNVARAEPTNEMREVLKLITTYSRRRGRETLARLEFEVVRELLARSRERRSRGPSRTGRSDPLEPVVPLLAQGNVARLSQLADEIHEAIGRGEEEAEGVIENPLTGEKFGRVIRHAKLWPFLETTQTESVWGGIVRAHADSLFQAVSSGPADDIVAFNPLGPGDLVETIEELVSTHVLDRATVESFREAARFRAQLLPYVRDLLEHPALFMVAQPAVRAAAEGYLSRIGEVYGALRQSFDSIHASGAETAETIVGTLLSLDQAVVVMPNGQFMVLALPLNAIELWKYVTLARQMLDQVPGLDQEEQELLDLSLHHLPVLLKVLLVPNFVTGHGVRDLVFSGRIGNLPFYEEAHQRFRDLDGMEELEGLADRVLNVYTHARDRLRIALIEPPNLVEAIASLSEVLGSHRSVEMQITVFREKADGVVLGLPNEEDEEALSSKIFAGQKRRLTIEFESLPAPRAYDLVAKRLEAAPVHMAVVFDPSNLVDHRYQHTAGPEIHPLSVPMSFRYDTHKDKLSLVPEPEGPLFSDRSELESRLGHHVRGTFPALVADFPRQVQALNEIANHVLWLVIADFASDTSLPISVPRVGLRRSGNREMTVYTTHLDKFERAFDEQLRLNNFDPQPERLHEALRALTELTDEGMLAVIARRPGSAALQPRLVGAIGVLVAAAQLRSEHPNAIIVSIDGPLARRWLRTVRSDKRADVVALIDHEDHIELRILEVKSHGEPFDDVAIDGDHVSGDAIVQLERTADVLDAIFGNSPGDILTPARREVLRAQIFSSLKVETRERRQHWWSRLNELFAGHIAAKVTIELSSVQMGKAS